MSRKLLSLVIPTRNRAELAVAAVRQALALNDSRLEVVVHDNGDDRKLEKLVRSIESRSELVYGYSSQILTFSENFEAAVSLASGQYVCVIGDDDGVDSSILDLCAWALKHQVEAVIPSLGVVYYWPGSVDGHRADLAGSLIVNPPNRRLDLVYPRQAVAELMDRGGLDYNTLAMVRIYHGIVASVLLDRVRESTGRYFGGLSPDIYSSVALSLVADRVVSIGWPVTIPGVSRQSGSGASAAGTHVGRLEDAPHLVGQTDYQWSAEVPRVYSVETIWADSALAAVRDMGEERLLDAFRPEILRWGIWFRQPALRHLLDRGPRLGPWGSCLFGYLRPAAFQKAGNLLSRLKRRQGRIQFRDLHDISEASACLEDSTKSQGLNEALLDHLWRQVPPESPLKAL